MRLACVGEPFYEAQKDKRYCVLHFPDKLKSADFKKALQRKLENKDFDFRGVWFPDEVSFTHFDFSAAADFCFATFTAEADFRHATFSAEANFIGATFRAKAFFIRATFSAQADFRRATFTAEANFSEATFKLANFGSATFKMAAFFLHATFRAASYFSEATFKLANFGSATFSADADFRSATFSAEANFSSATFEEYVEFFGNENRKVFSKASSLDFQFARIKKADQVSFHTLSLRPHWFVEADARKFDFIKVDWDWRDTREEVESLELRGVPSPHRTLAIACRHLAVNAEENHRYEEASRFRYMAMDVTRHEPWRPSASLEPLFTFLFAMFVPVSVIFVLVFAIFVLVFAFLGRWFAFWRLSWWYWFASGYGERVLKAFLVLLGILLLSAFLYNHVGFVRWEPKQASESEAVIARRDGVGAPLPFKRALTYSLGVMTLQKPEPRPATTAAQTVVLFETILGPVQAALLALAIRRKFMR
jgi:uncharacterized protein YjbI with pentapeptide repeats